MADLQPGTAGVYNVTALNAAILAHPIIGKVVAQNQAVTAAPSVMSLTGSLPAPSVSEPTAAVIEPLQKNNPIVIGIGIIAGLFILLSILKKR